ncbi:MAG: PbpA [Desulfobacterium sp.]|nr:PbpA [Desulfobacterium sp.]
MPNKMKRPIRREPSWQEYQFSLQRKAAYRKQAFKFFQYFSGFIILVVIIYGTSVSFSGTVCQQIFQKSVILSKSSAEEIKQEPTKQEQTKQEQTTLLTKKDVQGFMRNVDFLRLDDTRFSVKVGNRSYLVETTLDNSLQHYLSNLLDRKNARNIGIVLMNPRTGEIHALVGFDRTGENKNTCIEGLFPAASVFKIITAAAGIEKCGFSTGSSFTFYGGKHTLYKSQLRDGKNRRANRISFQDSFAQSVNPVFGKIGANYLGRETLIDYAESFGFNRTIDFEMPMTSSCFSSTDKTFQLAEAASGFNRETTITPMHGALISAAIVNKGGLVEPTVIQQIRDEKGEIVYRNEPKVISYVATEGTSRALYTMMRATVSSGTSRKAFRGANRDKILSQLDIGSKTGSIGSRKLRNVRYDWFVGFAEEKNGNEKLAVSVVVAHEKVIGKKAGLYARDAIKQYFQHHFDQKQCEMHTRNISKGKNQKPV